MSPLNVGKIFPAFNFLNYKSTRYLADQLKVQYGLTTSIHRFLLTNIVVQNYRKTKQRILRRHYTVFSIFCTPFLYYYYLHLKNCLSKSWFFFLIFFRVQTKESDLHGKFYVCCWNYFRWKSGIGVELYYWWKVQEKNVNFCLIKHVQI